MREKRKEKKPSDLLPNQEGLSNHLTRQKLGQPGPQKPKEVKMEASDNSLPDLRFRE